jgi:NADH dehydrogenase
MATLGRRHGIAVLGRVHVRGAIGWAVARGYHLVQLPFTSRRIRVMADWLAAACFRRDVSELTLPTDPKETPTDVHDRPVLSLA